MAPQQGVYTGEVYAPSPTPMAVWPSVPPPPPPTDPFWKTAIHHSNIKDGDRPAYTTTLTLPNGYVVTEYYFTGATGQASTSADEAFQAAATTITDSQSTNHPHHSPSAEAGQLDPPPHHGPQIFAAVGVVALFMSALALVCCFLLYRRKKQQRHSVAQMEERQGILGLAAAHPKTVRPAGGQAAPINDDRSYIHPPLEPPPALLANRSLSSVPSSSSQDPPVILSRTMDTSYYTGIDTSDHISLVETRSQSSSEHYAESQDEPPPPYRPASVPPISRDNSVRLSGIALDRNLRNSVRTIRSPFDDPDEGSEEDDSPPAPDTTRTPSQPTGREADATSVVSDLSYQDEARPHSNL